MEKYISFLKENHIDYMVYGWDRNQTGAQRDDTEYYQRKVGYVVGGFKAAYNRLFWFVFLIQKLRKSVDSNTLIHACDIDTAFPAALYKFIFNKEAVVLFDVFDWLSAMSAKSNPLLLNVIKRIEGFTLKYVNKVFICEEERRCQIPENEKYDISVLPNIPMVKDTDQVRIIDKQYSFDKNLPTLSYVGWFSYGRFIEELLQLARKGKINLLIAGYGNEEIENACNSLKKRDNFKFFGRVAYNDGLRIMYNSDIIYAMYCKVEPNHYYAAPNKFYECMLLGKPILTTKGIIIGDKVEKLGIGYTIEETTECLENLVENLDKEDIKKKADAALQMWETTYSNYTRNFLNSVYIGLLT